MTPTYRSLQPHSLTLPVSQFLNDDAMETYPCIVRDVTHNPLNGSLQLRICQVVCHGLDVCLFDSNVVLSALSDCVLNRAIPDKKYPKGHLLSLHFKVRAVAVSHTHGMFTLTMISNNFGERTRGPMCRDKGCFWAAKVWPSVFINTLLLTGQQHRRSFDRWETNTVYKDFFMKCLSILTKIHGTH